MKKISIFTDYCPYLDQNHSIKITYGRTSFVGHNKEYFLKLSYSCDNSLECTFKDEFGECEVYQNAPDDI